MKKKIVAMLALLVISCFASLAACSNSREDNGENDLSNNDGVAFPFQVGVGQVDVTPNEPLPALMGGASAMPAQAVALPLFVKAIVVAASDKKIAMITLDILKYPSSQTDQAAKRIEEMTGIPADHITITASHTHSGPLFNYYEDSNGNDKLTDAIVQAVQEANADLTPVKLGVATADVADIAHNRRVLIDGEAWNDWFFRVVASDQTFPAAGPVDPELLALAAVQEDGTYKAILWNYAAHPNANNALVISADYPGYVQQFMNEALGYDTVTLYATGASGDVNPSNKPDIIARTLAAKLVESLKNVEFIRKPVIYVDQRTLLIPGRENPVFAEDEISAKWPNMLESYRSSFNSTLMSARDKYETNITGIRIGDDFSIVTSPGELFVSIGLDIKSKSPIKHTMVVEQTNGAIGYIPAANDFELKGYETWYGEHSNLSVKAGETIRSESLDILKKLHKKK